MMESNLGAKSAVLLLTEIEIGRFDALCLWRRFENRERNAYVKAEVER